GLAVETEATWQFADIQLFGGNVAVSWGGVGGINDERATIVARANGQPNGADVTVSELPAMTIAIGDAELDIEPGLGIELDELFEGTSAEFLLSIIDGEITYGGPTNIVEAQDGTTASGSLNGLQADTQILGVPVVLPNGLGSLELGFERADVASTMSAGGINCVDDSD